MCNSSWLFPRHPAKRPCISPGVSFPRPIDSFSPLHSALFSRMNSCCHAVRHSKWTRSIPVDPKLHFGPLTRLGHYARTSTQPWMSTISGWLLLGKWHVEPRWTRFTSLFMGYPSFHSSCILKLGYLFYYPLDPSEIMDATHSTFCP